MAASNTTFKPEDLNALRTAAEQAWGDDTRHPNFQGDALPSAGQCYVTSRWLQSRYGGHVGVKNGHYFWVSEDKSHVVDLTGDQFAYSPADPAFEGLPMDDEDEPWRYDEAQKTWRPGPPLYKRSTHPLFKNFRTKTYATENPRVRTFTDRANAALDNPGATTSKVALDYAGDAYPAEQPQALEDHSDRYWHDLPDESPKEYKFFYGKGDLHVSPVHSHDELRGHAGVPDDHTGPMAVGFVTVQGRRAAWSVNANVGAQALARVLKDYTERAGWEWGGLTDVEGEPIGTGSEFAPKKTYYYAWDRDLHHLHISRDLGGALGAARRANTSSARAVIPGHFVVQGERVYASMPRHDHTRIADALAEYATDHGLVILAEVPGGGTFEDRMHKNDPSGETLEQFDLGDIDQHRIEPRDQEMGGPFECPDCHQRYPDWGSYVVHRQGEHMPTEEPVQDGKFPNERPDLDEAIPPHYREMFQTPVALASLRIDSPDETTEPLLARNGWIRASKTSWRYSLTGQQPKDMIDEPVPIVFDVRKDTINVGQPGQKVSEIPGKFTPGGIVEGQYMPGGKLVLRSVTSDPYSVYHLADLWYWSYPHMKLTGIELQDDAGNTTKLAGENVGSYVRQLALIDPAAASAYHALSAAGGKTYAVGGAVRDALLQKEPKDIDLLVSGLPAEAVRKALEALPGRVDLTGKDFGVFRYRAKGHEVEIALPRTETSTGEKRSEFDVQVDHNLPVETDLKRRDFTANSMAVDLDSGQLIDPYGGADDIAARRLQTTHPNSFEEDATRLVRALVASSRHGLQPTERTRREIEQNAYRLDGEARERVQAELDKLFASDNPAGAVRLAQDTGLLKHIVPDLAENFDYDQRNPHHAHTLGTHSLNVLEGVQQASTDPDLRLAALLHDVGKPASASRVCTRCRAPLDKDAEVCDQCNSSNVKNRYYLAENGQGANHDEMGATLAQRWMRDMKYPVSRTKRVHDLVRHHMFPAFSSQRGARKFLNRVGDHADDLLTLRAADQEGKGTPEFQATKTPVEQMQSLVEDVRAEAQPTNQAALAVNGNDLIAAGIPAGPQLGRILQQLTDLVISDPSQNNPETLVSEAQGLYGTA